MGVVDQPVEDTVGQRGSWPGENGGRCRNGMAEMKLAGKIEGAFRTRRGRLIVERIRWLGGDCPPPKYLSTSSRNVSRDFVEGRTGNLISVNLRRSFNDFRKILQQSGISITAISVRVFFLMP